MSAQLNWGLESPAIDPAYFAPDDAPPTFDENYIESFIERFSECDDAGQFLDLNGIEDAPSDAEAEMVRVMCGAWCRDKAKVNAVAGSRFWSLMREWANAAFQLEQ
jgi:hypothetical protein